MKKFKLNDDIFVLDNIGITQSINNKKVINSIYIDSTSMERYVLEDNTSVYVSVHDYFKMSGQDSINEDDLHLKDISDTYDA